MSAELAELSFLFKIFDEWLEEGQTPFQAEGERRDVQKAKNLINHPPEMPHQSF